MQLQADKCLLRPWQPGDEDALVRQANNRKVWRNLTEMFPHPYTLEDAKAWIARCQEQTEPSSFAILVEGELAGGIGFVRKEDVMRYTASMGYWLGEAFWGRGIATDALQRLTRHVFSQTDIARLEASVFAWNPASARVLVKAGFTFEGSLRQRAYKDGEHVDMLFYALLRDE